MYRIHHTIDPTNISIVDEEMDLSANNTKSAENVLEIAREPSKLDFHFSAVFAVASPTVQQQQQQQRYKTHAAGEAVCDNFSPSASFRVFSHPKLIPTKISE